MNEPPKVIQHDTFTNPEGETVNRLVVDVNGHNVQVLQYDDSPRLLVKIDEHMAQVDESRVSEYVANRTQE